MRRSLIVLTTLALALAATPAAAEAPTEVTVGVADFAFSPPVALIRIAGVVTWHRNSGTHTVTDGTELYSYNRTLNESGEQYSRRFTAAGNFAYLCTIHSDMTGRVAVEPRLVVREDEYVVAWASVDAPPGYIYDVKFKGPGETEWTVILHTIDSRMVQPMPSEPGSYHYRARIRKIGVGASRYSPVVSFGLG